jgi:hypothetical protein
MLSSRRFETTATTTGMFDPSFGHRFLSSRDGVSFPGRLLGTPVQHPGPSPRSIAQPQVRSACAGGGAGNLSARRDTCGNKPHGSGANHPKEDLTHKTLEPNGAKANPVLANQTR